MTGGAGRGYQPPRPIHVLRDPEDWELWTPCDGCRSGTIVAVLEVGTTVYRMCGDCLAQLRAAVSLHKDTKG